MHLLYADEHVFILPMKTAAKEQKLNHSHQRLFGNRRSTLSWLRDNVCKFAQKLSSRPMYFLMRFIFMFMHDGFTGFYESFLSSCI